MNTTKLKRFATEARNKLRQGVINNLGMLGFDEAGVPAMSPRLVPGGAVWKDDKRCTVAFYNGFKTLEEQIRLYGVSHVVEEAAYTWFNRLMAIRILTMNELCEPVLRYVGSTRTPLIVDEARQGHIPEMDEEDREALMKLLDDDTKTPEQFAMLISAFCHNTPLIAKCFGLQSDYTDVLFPANILSENGFIDMLNTTDFITEEDYRSSELLGWLYQFYISEKKDQVFAKKGKYDADDIPAATQIFTPNWIVKYMVQNSIGGVLGGKDKLPENQRKYYVDTPVPPTAICHDIEELKVADLACGSGHILNECFDLLYDLYISEGYTRREAIENIFTKNLTGIDIDTRAKQLATFALVLKACQRDSSFVDASLMPHVYDMSGMPEESRELGSIQIFDEPDSDNPVIAALSTHYDAIVMNPPYMGSGSFSEILADYVKKEYPNSKSDLMTVFMEVCIRLCKKCGIWSMINLPSWMFIGSFENLRESLLSSQHIISLLHLGRGIFGSDFGSVAFVIQNTQNSSFGVYRRLFKIHVQVRGIEVIRNHFFNAQYGYYRANQSNFCRIPGTPIAYWLTRESIDIFSQNKSVKDYAKPSQGLATGENDRFLRLWYEVDSSKFSESEDCQDRKWIPISKGGSFRRWYGNMDYAVNWANNGYEIKNFRDDKGKLRSRPQNIDLYFKKDGATWSTITSGKVSFRFFSRDWLFETKGSVCFPYDEEDSLVLLGYLNTPLVNHLLGVLSPTLDYHEGPIGRLPYKDIKSLVINDYVKSNIIISKEDWDAHETSWDFQRSPLLDAIHDCRSNVADLDMLDEDEQKVIRNMAQNIYNSGSLEECVNVYKSKWERLFFQLHCNEEELNRQFIEIYGLQDELTPDVPLDEVSILQQGEISINPNPEVRSYPEGDKEITYRESPITFNYDVIIRQFISYAMGCMMGRYRLDRPGLAIAHPNESPEEVVEYDIPGTNEKFWIDDDGIIPLMPEDCGFHDNAANRMATFVRQVFGEETQTQNLNYIEDCLGKSIEQYFIKDFWKDHKKMYQNRPIYWLFASKKGAFQVLVYVHRMNVATVERIRSRYLLPYIERLNKRIDDLQSNESTLSTKQRNQLKTLKVQVAECEEYHNRLAVIAERGIVPNLDDGIIKNHALYGDIVTKLK